MNRILRLLGLVVSSLLLFSCTNSGGGSGSESETPSNGSSFRTECGVVVDGSSKNPVDSSEGVLASVEITGPNQAIVVTGKARFLVKFHGLANLNDFRRSAVVARLQSLAQQGAVFFEASSECLATVDGGGTAFVGQLFTSSGVSYNETVIQEGLARIDTSEDCVPEDIVTCYRALEDSSEQLGGEISNFLWKPKAEKDGNLVVLLNPSGARITVNGDVLTDFGPSNGRGTTSRAGKSGCAYGANVVVKVFDE